MKQTLSDFLYILGQHVIIIKCRQYEKLCSRLCRIQVPRLTKNGGERQLTLGRRQPFEFGV